MKIAELKPGMNNVDVEVKIDFAAKKQMGGYGEQPHIVTFVVDDAGGEIRMTFWGDDVKKAKEGAKVRIKNGYVTEFRGTMQLGVGKEGKIEFI